MLTLDNFESMISSAVVKRGYDYFNNGLVFDMEESDNHVWSAGVAGSEDYSVKITVNDKNEITAFSCDCPYDGPLCKHVVALCYAVRKEKKADASGNADKKKKNFDKLLDKISPDEYKDFIRKYTAQDKDFKTKFELFFASKDDHIDIEKKYESLLKKMIRKYSDCGFIDYRATYGLSSETDKLLKDGREMIIKKNYKDAFLLVKTILKGLIDCIGECDDSNGNIGDVLSETISLMDEIAQSEDASIPLKEQIFDFLKTELADKVYFDYGDFGYELFATFHYLAVRYDKSSEYIAFVDDMSSKLTGKYDDYRKEFLQKQKISFYAETGQTCKAKELTKANMDIVEVRLGEVNKAIGRNDFDVAKHLIAEGIKIAESKQHPGTVSQWQKELLRIAMLENDKQTIRKLAQTFAFDMGFDKDYYRQWKKTYSEDEWTEVIENYIIDTVSKQKKAREARANARYMPFEPYFSHSLAQVYIEEKYWDRLLVLLQEGADLSTLLKYNTYLQQYPKEMLTLYISELEEEGRKAGSRKEYARLADTMKSIIKLIPEGKDEIMIIARNLIAQNPRRPAMIEELNKVLKG